MSEQPTSKQTSNQHADEIKFVTCPECGNEQPDFGSNVCCEECKAGPMPYYDEDGNLNE